jgi:DnaJ-class molecular chaperone
MVTSISHYDILGVKQNATADEISKAYKRQCLAVHPDKNHYGEFLMQKVNEAKDVLLDQSARRQYDHQLGRSGNGLDVSSNGNEIRRLQELLDIVQSQLREAQKECRKLDGQNRDLKVELYDKDRQIKELNHDLEHETAENNQLKHENDLLKRENREKFNIITGYEHKVIQLNHEMQKEAIRSVCYKCDGRAVLGDCDTCQGNGTVLGTWTKCHNCNGMGSHLSIRGAKTSCGICFGMGARQGQLSMLCFKCKGNPNQQNCSVCYKGQLRGFNLRLCPFCAGEESAKCENCHGNGFVSCRCGFGCKGHGREIAISSCLQANLLRRDKGKARKDRIHIYHSQNSFGVQFSSQNWNVSSLQQARVNFPWREGI